MKTTIYITPHIGRLFAHNALRLHPPLQPVRLKWALEPLNCPSSKRGVEDKVYPPGSTYFFVPFLSDWNTFDTRLFSIDMTGHEMRGDRAGKDESS